MIADEREYQVTKAEAAKFERALAEAQEPCDDLHPRLQQAMREGLESQPQDLQQDLAEYEGLRDGRARLIELRSLEQLPEALIQIRIASGLSQEALARQLGVRKQQVQNDERTHYASASFAHIIHVCGVLGITLRQRLLFPVVHSEQVTGFHETENSFSSSS